jgi:hypothetical protein
MFHEIGTSRFVHREGSETTRSNPFTFARQAWMMELSAVLLEVASAVNEATPASAARPASSTSRRGRGTRKAFGMTLLSRWAFSGSREFVPCL